MERSGIRDRATIEPDQRVVILASQPNKRFVDLQHLADLLCLEDRAQAATPARSATILAQPILSGGLRFTNSAMNDVIPAKAGIQVCRDGSPLSRG
jgi:hypothetical protein